MLAGDAGAHGASADQYDWNMLPIGQQPPESYNLGQVLEQVKKNGGHAAE